MQLLRAENIGLREKVKSLSDELLAANTTKVSPKSSSVPPVPFSTPPTTSDSSTSAPQQTTDSTSLLPQQSPQQHSPQQTHHHEETVAYYDQNPLGFLFTIFTVALYVYKRKVIRISKEKAQLQEEINGLRQLMLESIEMVNKGFKSWGDSWKRTNKNVKVRHYACVVRVIHTAFLTQPSNLLA